jgi:hypothetical protein
MIESTLIGDGTRNHPWFIRGFRSHEFTSIHEVLSFFEEQDGVKLGIAHSGRGYERRTDGWYETGTTDYCCKFHSLPLGGRKIDNSTGG